MFSNIDTRLRIGEIIYLVYFVLMMGARALGMYEGTTVYTVVLVIAMLLFAAKMMVTPHTIREYVIAVILMGIAGIVYMHTGEKGLIVCFSMMLGIKGVDKIRALRYGTIAATVCIFGRIITGVFGLLPEKYYPQVREGVGLMFRHSLGYAHPNTLHMNVLMLSMLVIFLLTNSLGLRRNSSANSSDVLYLLVISTVVLLFNLYVFQYSGSRTGVLAVMAYLIVNMWFYLRKRAGVFERIVCYAAYPIVCFLAIVLPLVIPDPLFDFVDRTVFTTRFTIARYFWSHNSLSMWGIRLTNPDPQYRTYGIDMSQLYVFLQLGLVAFAVIAVMTMWYVHQALKKNHMAELAVLMGTLFAGIWEPFLYNLGFKNFTFVFIGAMMYEVLAEAKTSEDKQVNNNESEAVNQVIWFDKYSLIRIICSILLGTVLGCVASSTYVLFTEPPHALYADREQDEAGVSFEMEPLYLSSEEIAELKGNGELIVGYQDENKPMYMYDESIAVMEYHKRCLSIRVWCGMLVMFISLLFPTGRYPENISE
ncbi:MAG: hypothetical protein K5673_03725 [Lachnospiraceae bacterium]|nr:hypothetical protein [Lachnospiraceae bacterium]